MRTLPLVAFFFFASVAQAAINVPLDAANKPDMGKGAASVAQVAPEEKAKAIADIETYLSGISSIVANFTQTATDGSKGSGKFFLKRPGKFRLQYDPPTPILLVSDGKVVTYYDAGLDQVTYIGADDTLASFIARKDIKLDNTTTRLTDFEKADGVVKVTMVQRQKPDEGSLTLEFTEKPIAIKDMITTDATGNKVTVVFTNAQFGPVLDDKLFLFSDPRGVNQRRNKRS